MKKFFVVLMLICTNYLVAQVPPGYITSNGLTISQVGFRAIDQKNIIGNGYFLADGSGKCYGLSVTRNLYYYDAIKKQINEIKGVHDSLIADTVGNVYALDYNTTSGMGTFLQLNGAADPVTAFSVKLNIQKTGSSVLFSRDIFIAGDFVYELVNSINEKTFTIYKTNMKTGFGSKLQIPIDVKINYIYSMTANDSEIYALAYTRNDQGTTFKDVFVLDYRNLAVVIRKTFTMDEIWNPNQTNVNSKYLMVADYNHVIYYDIFKDKALKSLNKIAIGNGDVIDTAMTETGIFYYMDDQGKEVLYFYEFKNKKITKIYSPEIRKDLIKSAGSVCSIGNIVSIIMDNRILRFADGVYKDEVAIVNPENFNEKFFANSGFALGSSNQYLIAGNSPTVYQISSGTVGKLYVQKDVKNVHFIYSVTTDGKGNFYLRTRGGNSDAVFRYGQNKSDMELLFERPKLDILSNRIIVLPNGNLVINANKSIEIVDIKGGSLLISEKIPGYDYIDSIADMEFYRAKNLIVCLQSNTITVYDATTLKIKKTVKLTEGKQMEDFTITEKGDIYVIDYSDYCVLIKGLFTGL